MTIGAPVIYSSQAYKASDGVLASPMTLQLAEGYNPNGSALFLLYFNLAAVPGGGAVPLFGQLVPGGASFSWAPIDVSSAGQEGRKFSIACSWGISSTGNVYTPSASAFWVDITGRRLT